MSEKVDVRQALRVFQFVSDNGTQCPGGYRLDGVTARTEQDGYSVALEDGRVCLRVGFHNSHSVDFDTRHDLDEFLAHLDKLDRLSRATDPDS